jgi:hypothetical protein
VPRRVQTGLLTTVAADDARLHEDVVDTLSFVCDYLSADTAALLALPPRVEVYKVLVPLIASATPRQGALWLAEALSKQARTRRLLTCGATTLRSVHT